LLLAVVLLVDAKAPLLHTSNPDVVPGRYIVMFHANLTAEHRGTHMKKLAAMNQNVVHEYSIGKTFQGYSAMLSDSALESVRAASEVDYVEAVQMMHVAQSCDVQKPSEWGLTRVTQRVMDLHGEYRYNTVGGTNVNVYVIDTGILDTHTDFGGRAKQLVNYVNDGKNVDCNGHGTHVAGTIGGTVYGIAKKANLFGVKVLSCSGSGTNDGVIKGINYVTTSGTRPAVINMSLGGGLSTAVNAAVDAAFDAGVLPVVAAGNSNADACNYSPASSKKVLTVAASAIANKQGNNEDARASYSNYGTCVDIFGPGSSIKSAWIKSNTDTNVISGTSMASPHVCGVAALYMSVSGKSDPQTVKDALIDGATGSEVDLICTNSACDKTPNKMVYSVCA
jgi:subtilisin family serine protease